ncbi:MAG TPA: arylsulfatase [Phycisphaerae bacterium]|nr:arylsulfatase [Phycisphaerae bacterium]
MPNRKAEPSLTRRRLLGAGLGAVGAAAAGCALERTKDARATAAPAGLPRKPNIIFILADDLGYGDVGCFGQTRIKTPSLDRLAAEGMRFTQAYAGSTVCAPSRCTLMTGLHTGHCWVRGNARVPLRPDDVTVAELLKAQGYATGIIGKWGLGEPETTGIPNRQGFDYWFGYLNQHHAHNYWPSYLWRNEERVQLKNVVPKEDAVGGGVASQRVEYSHDLFAAEALGFVEKHKKGPFFLYLALTIPHANNEAGKTGMEVPGDEPYAAESWPQQQKNHAAMITRMDRDIGRLMALLEQLGIDDQTLVIFTSDNGPHREGGADPDFFDANGPLKGIKRDLYEGGIRVPTMARWPGRIEAGSVSDHAWAFWDFLPTACELAGAPVPKDIDGLSFVPALLGKPQEAHECLYWEFHERGISQAVRMGNWKGVRRGSRTAATELYDLAKDLGEATNVAADHPDVVKKIEDLFAAARTDNPNFPVRDAKPRPPTKKPAAKT